MTVNVDPRAEHREHIQQRAEFVRGKRGPVSFVCGSEFETPRAGSCEDGALRHVHANRRGQSPRSAPSTLMRRNR